MVTAAPYGPMWLPGDCTPEQKLPVTWEEQTQIAVDCYDIVLWGSSTLYPQLLEANLIDRFLLLTCPIVLGKGKKLFGSTAHPVTVKLVRNDISSTGVIIATYERKG